MMSTAHRVLDGVEYIEKTESGRNIRRWLLDEPKDLILYKATHVNHPTAIWVRESKAHYNYTYELFAALSLVYYQDRSREHATYERLGYELHTYPKNMPDNGWTDPPLCMPWEYHIGDAVESYREFYIKDKSRFAKWKNRTPPQWYIDGVRGLSSNVNN